MHPRYRYRHERAEENLGTALLEFLKLYGEDINLDKVGISVRKGGYYFEKQVVGEEKGWRDMNAWGRL